MLNEHERRALQKATPKTDRTIEVIMDSNALFVPMQFKIDIIGELERLLGRRFELILLSPVRHELELLASEKSPKTAKMVAFALKFAEKCRLVDSHSSSQTVDDAIVETAAKCRNPVFTNDAQLRKRLRNISVPVIYVRQKSHLAIEGMIQSHV
jgi:rRNA-processing protein FCF1